MKKFIQLFAPIGIAASSLFLGPHAFALDPGATEGAVSQQISTETNLVNVAFTVANWILSATFAFAVIMIIVAGFRYITSAGNEAQAEAAKENITQAVIGLVIVLLAFVIASTINQIFTGPKAGGGATRGGGGLFGFI